VSVWTGAQNLAFTGNQSADRPACSESLYRLNCRGAYVSLCTVLYEFYISDLKLNELVETCCHNKAYNAN
jgi:hypothetical protein